MDETKRRQPYFVSRQFENKLFDRDMLLVFHYDVNFLYVVSLYARDNAGRKVAWRNKVRDVFREKIQEILGKQYQFYAMRQLPGVDGAKYIWEHFKQLLGKVYARLRTREYIHWLWRIHRLYRKCGEKLLRRRMRMCWNL